ncbi:MAG: hypothetical protein J6U16_04015 [Ruminococcus sp.]|nr:hypothetical protein [Ruminococcus sp.]
MIDKHDIDELFGRTGDELPEQLPLLSAEERNRIYKMSERKFNKDTMGKFETGDSVSGVERYSRPVWKRRLASVAAAGVLLAGSGGLAYYVKNGTLDGFSDSAAVDMMSPSSDKDYEEIATYLLDGYVEFLTRLECPQGDPRTIVTLRVEGDDIKIARLADDKIKSIDDFRALGAKYMTEEYINNNYDLGEAIDKSAFVEGESYSASDFYAEDPQCARFFLYNGKLYTYYFDYSVDVNTHLIYDTFDITEKDEDSFTVKVMFNRKGEGYDSTPADLFKYTHGETVEKPYVIEVVRNEAGEWRIASTNIDDEKVNELIFEADIDSIETAKRFSDRYVQLQDYIYERPVSETDSISFTVQIGSEKRERMYYKIEDDYSNNDNPYWNAHSIEEIRIISGMDFSLFYKLYGSEMFGKVDDSVNEGDLVSFEENEPYFIEYKGAMYAQGRNEDREMIYQYQADRLLLPFTDEPEIVSSDPLEIVFRRKTGHRSNYSEINQMPMTYEFKLWKLKDCEWHVTSVEKVASESGETSNEGDQVVRASEEIGDLVEEYAELMCALASHHYISAENVVTYNLKDGDRQEQIMFAPYSNPIYDTPEKVETAVKRIFTKKFMQKYLDPNPSDDEIDTVWKVKDFSRFKNEDVLTEAELSEDYGKNTPYPYVFILLDGMIYRKMYFAFAIPYFSDEVHSISCDPVTEGDTADVSAEYTFTTDIGQTKTVNVEFSCVKEENSWKIDDVAFQNG